jgi:hypothetical protein
MNKILDIFIPAEGTRSETAGYQKVRAMGPDGKLWSIYSSPNFQNPTRIDLRPLEGDHEERAKAMVLTLKGEHVIKTHKKGDSFVEEHLCRIRAN